MRFLVDVLSGNSLYIVCVGEYAVQVWLTVLSWLRLQCKSYGQSLWVAPSRLVVSPQNVCLDGSIPRTVIVTAPTQCSNNIHDLLVAQPQHSAVFLPFSASHPDASLIDEDTGTVHIPPARPPVVAVADILIAAGVDQLALSNHDSIPAVVVPPGRFCFEDWKKSSMPFLISGACDMLRVCLT